MPESQFVDTDAPLKFGSDQILWYNNGRWGEAGYAIPNPGVEFSGMKPVPGTGKLWVTNTEAYSLSKLIGATMFELAHREDARFTRPPNVKFLYDLHSLIIAARNRLAARAVPLNEEEFRAQHATPAPRVWPTFPVPFFRESRIRNEDIRQWLELMLLCQTEIMQHSDADKSLEISQIFAGQVGKYLKRVLFLMGTKFFGATRAEAQADNFEITAEMFQNYSIDSRFVFTEITESRPPLQAHPTENDLSGIKGVAITDALLFAEKWPQVEFAVTGTAAGIQRESGASATGGSFIPPAGSMPRV